eukprot:TRINITY_DN282_c0_g1_i2.p1 TRINITY_DN282_c0_g1~~TRINITY_DN282_c0_g1_i2.p1  ORF type:complete len:215 (-),score=23.50 TRINITY_DN282_c0_g1_i2:126-770(-)
MGSRPYLVVNDQPFLLDTSGRFVWLDGARMNWFHKYLTTNCFCRKEVYGTLLERGHKFACADFIIPENCLALSLGSDDNVAFEIGVAEKKKCRILRYNTKAASIKKHDSIAYQGVTTIGSCTSCTPLKDLVPVGGVDMFKIDMEKEQWHFVDDLLTLNANMLQMQIIDVNLTTLHRLARLDENWCLASVETNVYCPSCLELLFVNRRLTTLNFK